MPPEILTRIPEGCQLPRMLDESMADSVMTSFGGMKVPDRDGTYWVFTVDEVVAQIIPFSRNSKGMLMLGLAVSVSQPQLMRIANILKKRRADMWHQMDYHQVHEMMPINGNVKACLTRVVEREIQHLKSMHLDGIIAKFEVPYPSVESKPLEQITHLAALAFTGNIRQLTEYLNWFKQGKRYNFRDSITQETIEAALAVAHEQISR